MSHPPKILIIRLSSLGDILHVLPAFSALRSKFPDAEIDWLAAPKSEFLVRAVRGVSRIHVIDANSLLRSPFDSAVWRRFWDVIAQLRARHYDVALDFQGLLKTASLGLLTGSRTRVGFSRELVREPPAQWFYNQTLKKPPKPVHVLVQNRMLAELIGAPPVTYPIDFSIPDDDCLYVDSLLSRTKLDSFVVINPGGGWPTKRWAPGKYGLLAKKIQGELGIPVGVTTGPGEEALYKEIAVFCGEPPPRHLPVSFLQLIPLLKKARLFIGGDTGPFHLACSLLTPVVGIFGPTSPVRNGPWGYSDEVVHHPMPCSNCYGRTCPTKNECMDIGVDEVFEAVIRRMGIREEFSIARS